MVIFSPSDNMAKKNLKIKFSELEEFGMEIIMIGSNQLFYT
jgi:hypothetical protein